MMKISKSILLLLFAFLFLTCETEGDLKEDYQNFFVKHYGGDGNQEGVDMVVNQDGTIMLLGNSDDLRDGKQFFVVKVDADGKIIWQKTYGDTSDELAVDIEPTGSGNYIIAVQKTIAEGIDTDVKLLTITGEGNGLDSVNFGYADEIDLVKSITTLQDGSGFVMTGSTTRESAPPNILTKVFHFRCNEDLVFDTSLLWYAQQTLIGDGEENFGIRFFEDKLYSGAPNESRFFLFLYADENQNDVALDKSFGASGVQDEGTSQGLSYLPTTDNEQTNDFLSQAERIDDENFVLIGTSVGSQGNSEIEVVKARRENFNPSFVSLKRLDITGNHEGVSIIPTKVNGFLILANEVVTVASSVNRNLTLIRTSGSFSIEYVEKFGSEFNEFGGKVAELPDGKIILVGTATLDSQKKLTLIKLNEQGRFLD